MEKKNKLSIYLVKDKYAHDDNLILKSDKKAIADLENLGKVYYMPSIKTTPKWLDSFYCNKISSENIYTSNVRVVLIARVLIDDSIKTFAITMGYGKYLLESDVVENDFGLKTVLNTISSNSIRRINKVNIGGNQKASNEQLPLGSDINDFGFDIDRDLIGTITGLSNDEDFVEGMITGGDLLSVNAKVDINNLQEFLMKVYTRYCSNKYKESFGWVDQIKKVKDTKIIEKLENETIKLINNGSPNIWMAVPEVIDWVNVKGFKYTSGDFEYDIDIKKVVASFKKGLSRFEQLRTKTIKAISSQDENTIIDEWKANKCLFGEIELDKKTYCINNGNWYLVDNDYAKLINEDYEKTNVSNFDFAPCKKNQTENKYTTSFVSSNPKYLLSMDAKVVSYGSGRSKVELCDILTTDEKFIHIKPYSSSSVLSHLFNQAVVSAELLIQDKEFVKKANKKIGSITSDESFLLEMKQRPYVILGIITNKDGPLPQIPFFSKVTLRYTKQRLEAYGCTIEVKNIYKDTN